MKKGSIKPVRPSDRPTGTAQGMWTDWLTVPEAAKVLGVSKVRIYQMIRSKSLVSTTRWDRVFVSKLMVEQERDFRRTIDRIKRKQQEQREQEDYGGDAA